MPVSWIDPATATPVSGGFLTFPGASLATDSTVSGLKSPSGATWISYDAQMQRWVPANRDMVSPDGNTWIYGSFGSANQYHAVNVSTKKDTLLWGSDKLYRLIGLDNRNAYAMLDSAEVSRLWRLPLDGSLGGPLKVNGSWQLVNGGKVWGAGTTSFPGAAYSLQQLDVQANVVTTWIELDNQANLVGFDVSGAPLLQVGGQVGDVIVVPSPGNQVRVAKAFGFGSGPAEHGPMPAVGDEHGIWLAGADGIYLSIGGVANKQSVVHAFPAGPCL